MQNRDGGWASFDKDCNKEFLTYVPFADHNAMIDPSTTDITARALEALSAHGYDLSSDVVRRAVAFIRRLQKPDGTWYGRWGCNYIYGTWLALSGLEGCRRGLVGILGPERCRLVQELSELRRRMGRAARLLRRFQQEGDRAQHGRADLLVASGPDVDGRSRQRQRSGGVSSTC